MALALPKEKWLDGLKQDARRDAHWIWHGYVRKGSITLLTSQWKSGKTTLLAALLGHMNAGGELAGLAVAPGRAIVVSEESEEQWLGDVTSLFYTSSTPKALNVKAQGNALGAMGHPSIQAPTGRDGRHPPRRRRRGSSSWRP